MYRRALCFALLALSSTSAFAYTPNWLACDGDLTVTPAGGQPEKQAAHDIYVTDDDAKNLFKYAPERKVLNLVGVTAYTPQEVRWANSSGGMDVGSWEARLDRATGALTLNYKSKNETRVWAETCKPTQAQPEGAPN